MEKTNLIWLHGVRRTDKTFLCRSNEICANLQTTRINYWRDKRGHEIDLVIPWPENEPKAIEIKWKADEFEPRNLFSFRRHYPKGDNYVISSDIVRVFSRKYKDLRVVFCRLDKFFFSSLFSTPE